jgi:class 3 adenylate cyclase/DNA-binding CsgD family transcriptional regulator
MAAIQAGHPAAPARDIRLSRCESDAVREGDDGVATAETVVTTVLFVDVVHSTERAASLGDRDWGELLERYRAAVRKEVAAHGGREIDSAGDGFLACFAAPARALECSAAIVNAVAELGLEVRLGLHTGECEVTDDRVTGLAVHIGARVAGSARPGEILVSSTVKELLTGSSLRFVERGGHRLRGVPGDWQLFALESMPLRAQPAGRALVGRAAERARIDELLAAALAERSGVLVIRGEVGVGKTALLRYAIDRARGMTVLKARGVESESELPFAALNDLLRPVVHRLDAIPTPQREALEGALALGPPVQPGPFSICAATLSLLAAAAEDGPVLAVVDDAQWLDPSSAQAVLFASRRLGAEGVALCVGVREGEGEPFERAGLPEIRVTGLGPKAAAELLATPTDRVLAPGVAERLARATAGNPLALLELPSMLSDAQLAGEEPIPDPLPPGPAVRDAFLRRVAALSEPAQRALLVAAASDTGDLELLVAALNRLGIGAEALRIAEDAGLVTADGERLRLRHPLLRSAVYHGAPAAARRAVHQALAEASSDAESDRRAWHLAAATPEPDADVARALSDAAANARRRGGHAEAASAFERAARLTVDREEAAKLLLEAADAARLVGRTDEALQLVAEAGAHADDPLLRARNQHMRGSIEMWRGAPLAARDLLVDEAARIEELDPSKASRMLTDAGWASFMAAEIEAGLALAERASALAGRVGGISELVANGLLGIGLLLAGDARRAVPLLAKFQPLVAEIALTRPRQLIQPGGQVLVWAEEYGQARQLLTRMLETARSQSALGVLPYTLAALSELNFRTGNWAAAYAEASEAVQIARDIEQASTLSFSLVCLARVEAAQGREEDCRGHVAEALQLTAFGIGAVIGYAESTLGLLELGLGRPREAIGPLEQLADQARRHRLAEPGVIQWAPDLIEAYVRAGRPHDAVPELDRFESQARASRRTWALAAAARCRGLIAGEDEFEGAFAEALERLAGSPTPFERARTELCLGERLRRGRRRSDAREPLRRALETFERLGAAPWAERARTELRASGETARRGDPSAAEQLTPQELQVALVVGRGATNKEAGAALFLSEKTIEAHLGRIYRKLGIRSRTELASRLVSEGALVDAA